MKTSGDLVIGGSGDRKHEFTAEPRSRGENQKPTTEAQRHGDRSDDRVIARDGIDGAANSFYDVNIGHAAYICHPERVGANATASRRTPTMPVPKHAASGSSYKTTNLTAETRRRREDQKPTTEVLRHGEERRSSDFPDHPITCDHRIARSTSARALITKTIRILRATLREIFDESAYDRFLQRTKVPRSVTSYRDFMQEREAGMTRRPKCC